jgi:hypothetical protein
MSKVNLQSVLDNLIREDTNKATELLHQWFLEACADINDNIIREELHVHVHSNSPEAATEEDTVENLSPINGSQDMDTDGDSMEFSTDDDSSEDEDDDSDMFAGDDDAVDTGDGEDSEVEDDIDDLKAELEDLKKQLASQLGFDLDELGDDTTTDDDLNVATDDDSEEDSDDSDDDTDGDAEDSDNETDSDEDSKDDDEDKDNVFDDLDESFELEKVSEPDMRTPMYSGAGGKVKDAENDSSFALHDGPDIFAAKPVEIRAKEYTGTDRQPSPEVKAAPLRKNQVKSAADDLEKVPPMGPKNALLANSKDLYPEDKNQGSIIGTRDMRTKMK